MFFIVKDAINIVPFVMYASGGNFSLISGRTVTCTASKGGGAFAAISGGVTEISAGLYKVTLSEMDCNTFGGLALKFTATSSETSIIVCSCGYINNGGIGLGIPALPVIPIGFAGALPITAASTPNNTILMNSSGYVGMYVNGDKTGYVLHATNSGGVTSIRDSVWNATLSSYASAGSAGKKLTDILADVWTTLIPASYTTGMAGKIVGDNLDAEVSGASTLDIADVTTGVDAALNAVGTELSTVPTTTGSLRQKLNFLFQYFRNKRTTTSSVETAYKEDASTSLGTATISDNGTTFTKGEMN